MSLVVRFVGVVDCEVVKNVMFIEYFMLILLDLERYYEFFLEFFEFVV